MKKLWCDLRSDAERSDYILSGQAYDAGIITHAIQADVAMAFHRCSEYDAEVRRLREENERLKADADRLDELDAIAQRKEGADMHLAHGHIALYLRTGIGSNAHGVGGSDIRKVIDAARGGK